MTSPDRSKGSRSRDEVIAGEYVLGVLSNGDRRLVEERLSRDLAFAAIVRRWQENLLNVEEVAPVARPPLRIVARPAQPTPKVAQVQAKHAPRPGLWQSLVFWRMLATIAWIGLIAMLTVDMLKP